MKTSIITLLLVRVLERYALERIQNVPRSFSIGRLFIAYFNTFAMPMIAVRGILTQWVEIRLTKDNQSHLESALRSTYDGTAFWVNACPKTRSAQVIRREELHLDATSWKKTVLDYFQRPTICLPSHCEVLTKIHKEDIPLLLKYKIRVSQDYITKDRSITTKMCFIVIALYWAYIFGKYAYCLWMFRHIPKSYQAFYMFPPSMLIPFLYTSGKCEGPVFVSVESDGHSLRKDFMLFGATNLVSEDVYVEKISEAKDAVREKILKRHWVEQVLGSVLYLFLQFGITYGMSKLVRIGAEGVHPAKAPSSRMVAVFLAVNLEALIHSVFCIVNLGWVFVSNWLPSMLLSLISAILVGIFLLTELVFVPYV
ncbi:hypothetical protein K493DRAFT_314992 [Basidiobolus meristosporus CBS 931.73]|uniref:Uncharacterized protein n=1 Tax=Basidiobolus meristosporus CBS 931.73 TaxID=1314790 RepID=A0A1Y1YBW2_9FUNG|nr:hypothetical protein K493DRAFT_314992 [Basidiobolus meristosporus CBS 931.73]|eukprot:ORX95468.1 hypothetical protein K493DRAFT_314992 [Basidiobolus meristosporus CBS 931.73]